MKTATINEIKQELNNSTPSTLLDLCLRLARYKKENKELLTYLLFEAHDEQGYIGSVKAEIDAGFAELPRANAHLTKKSLRKILRTANKYIRYTSSKQAEAELLIYYCLQLKNSGLVAATGTAMQNLYQQQLKKIGIAVSSLHEDLQHDYKKEIAFITEMPVEKQRKKSFFGKW